MFHFKVGCFILKFSEQCPTLYLTLQKLLPPLLKWYKKFPHYPSLTKSSKYPPIYSIPPFLPSSSITHFKVVPKCQSITEMLLHFKDSKSQTVL